MSRATWPLSSREVARYGAGMDTETETRDVTTDEQDTEGHNTMTLQLGWDPIGERRRQAQHVARDSRPTVQEKRGIFERFRRPSR